VGNWVKSAEVHDEPVALGAAAEDTADIFKGWDLRLLSNG
jgi:hypothetical protein